MKVGILTQPLHNNYGGLLQNWALQQVLKGMGHEPETLNWHLLHASPFRNFLSNAKTKGLKLIGKGDNRTFCYNPDEKSSAIISQHTTRFVREHIAKVDIDEKGDFRKRALDAGYDAFMVGSDQVWRPIYNRYIESMFLDFATDIKARKIAYAASFGTDSWEYSPQLEKCCRELLRQFDFVSVRESSAVVLCKEHLGVDATHVLDPTMLLDAVDYERLAQSYSQSNGNLFYYILDPLPEKQSAVQSMAEALKLTPFTAMPEAYEPRALKAAIKKGQVERCIFPPPEQWLRGFMDAEATIVDSFHGAAFSIIFNKPFWVIANATRGNARFMSLLSLFGLEDRMVSMDNMCNRDWALPINWNRINEIRRVKKERCEDCLKQGLVG